MPLRRLILLCIVTSALAVQGLAQSPQTEFIAHRDGKLYEGDSEFRFVSWNIPNLHCVEDAFSFLGESPWRWPDAFEIADALESTSQMGGRVVRTYVISVKREGGDMGGHVHVLGPGEFNEEAFRTLDLVLKIARDKGIRVLIPLVDNWHWWGGVRQYEGFSNKPEGSFWSDPDVIADFKKTVAYVLNRRNSLTGVLYRDDPTILGWETGNELDATPEWTQEVAAYLKQIDPNHLVVDGCALHGVPVASLEDPNIDVVTTHHYPNVGNNDAKSVLEAVHLVDGKKAYFVGEFGFLPVEEAGRVLDAVIEEGVSGALYWSLRFHRREGGFYWHDEPYGDNLFKAYHWPGFAEGQAYREHLVLPMLREAAFRIQSLPTPEPPTPASPTLLIPDPHSPRRLSWQGSAGASGYRVQRATKPTGPWETLAENLSDAAVQYRPLFADESAEAGVSYFYRVIARNRSGDSPPSAPIGPLASQTRLLVDEFQDLTRLEASQGTVTLKTDAARETQEDIHRLQLTPGSHITYRLEGPCRSVKVWAFSKGTRQLQIEASQDGTHFKSVESTTKTTSAQRSDYDYLHPYLAIADSLTDARWVRLQIPGKATASPQLSRVEISFDDRQERSE